MTATLHGQAIGFLGCQAAPVWESERQPATSTTVEGSEMAESVYKVIELIGTSPDSWEKATAAAVQRASKTLRDLRVAEVTQLDVTIEKGKVAMYRSKLKVSFKYDGK
jgi:flavin-binding protein dodecin